MKKLTAPILLIASPSDAPDLFYSCEFWAPDPVVYLLTSKMRYLVVSRLEVSRARALAAASRTTPPMQVLTPEELGIPRSARGRYDEWALKLLRRIGVDRVHVPSTFPHGAAMRLSARSIKVSVNDAALFPQRAVKTPLEVEHITESQQAAVTAMRAAIDLIARTTIGRESLLKSGGKTLLAEDVQRRIHQVLLDHNCVCSDVIVAGGAQGADPHEKGHGPLKAREPIVIDIFPKHRRHGYWGDITRTVIRGKASTAQKRLYSAVRSAHAAALKRVAPRVQCASVHAAAAEALERCGFKTGLSEGAPVGFIHSTGHGVGLAIHEAPSVSLNTTRLKRGHVITIEPGLYYPALGGVRLEDTVVVTANGFRLLVPCEKRFVI
ncbi:MAG: Xaa-Pro peptidase family protein [Verrucomicrobia bacterium]|nr:Xaa-Pro peptidase family protein [Verrucomicrobiota bacterium]